ncbi:hypothetical protein SA46CTH2_5 [Staphylococcus phage SA46-CTH2]|uniref:Uncharacterized protein n=1 Tax=Staphylococcus phage SA46-CL1 TaxID=2591106 RepID=A0A6M2YED5_9CAUD|nr:hypothetical protein KNU60_gp05 [Staphylococcus phage SA46-CL1]QCW21990.1 hypothetical protein SA46CTH2_5 [Staphylococcus phage SA46-CTH2]QDH84825.1 hypothetical protein SA46CL1_5 [Staphylococcus phage SA46-CL1]QEM41188.1 hypothetical protein SA44CTH7_5 [Staphylococcus phage SA44-CTH7]
MNITTTLNTKKLINYILDNRDCFMNKITKFTSLSGKCVVFVRYGEITIEYYDSDTKNNNDLFTLDIDIDIKKHVFNILVFYYRDYLSNELKKEILLNVTIDDVLSNFDKPLESELMIIYQNKVIYKNGNVIEHE